jgi:hypothetical protein
MSSTLEALGTTMLGLLVTHSRVRLEYQPTVQLQLQQQHFPVLGSPVALQQPQNRNCLLNQLAQLRPTGARAGLGLVSMRRVGLVAT